MSLINCNTADGMGSNLKEGLYNIKPKESACLYIT